MVLINVTSLVKNWLLAEYVPVDHTAGRPRHRCDASRLAFHLVQRNWIVMQIVILILVLASIAIAASKLWL
ncbi:MAG: hypothetical protein ACPGWS_05175 [Solirubrobacterales bacterium]